MNLDVIDKKYFDWIEDNMSQSIAEDGTVTFSCDNCFSRFSNYDAFLEHIPACIMTLDFFEIDNGMPLQPEMATTADDKQAAQELFAPMICDLILGYKMPDDPDNYQISEMKPVYERIGKARRF
ncbi:MAG: hypothetical protein ACFFD4_08080 [Candidatus Odinarchaeota archaeon]